MLVCVGLAPASAVGGQGDLTFTGCIGMGTGCTPTTPAYLLDGADAVAISAGGSSVYVAANSGAEGPIVTGLIAIFSRNTATGALTYEGCIGNGSSSCVQPSTATAVDEPEAIVISPDERACTSPVPTRARSLVLAQHLDRRVDVHRLHRR